MNYHDEKQIIDIFLQKKREFWLSEYKEYLLSDEWKRKRTERFELDNFQCQRCKKIYRDAPFGFIKDALGREFELSELDDRSLFINVLNAHHKHYKNVKVTTTFKQWVGNGENFMMSFNENVFEDLISLCYKCHDKEHKIKSFF